MLNMRFWIICGLLIILYWCEKKNWCEYNNWDLTKLPEQQLSTGEQYTLSNKKGISSGAWICSSIKTSNSYPVLTPKAFWIDAKGSVIGCDEIISCSWHQSCSLRDGKCAMFPPFSGRFISCRALSGKFQMEKSHMKGQKKTQITYNKQINCNFSAVEFSVLFFFR